MKCAACDHRKSRHRQANQAATFCYQCPCKEFVAPHVNHDTGDRRNCSACEREHDIERRQ